MFVLGILRWLRGYVSFEATGAFPERFLNLTLREDIPLWDPVGEKGKLRAKTAVSSYKEIRPVAKRAGVRVRVKKRRGLPFIIHNNRKRGGLLAGAACFFILINIMSSFIWSVEISGLDHLSETDVRSALRDNGLSTGVFKDSFDIDRLERDATLQIGQVGWISVNVIGTTAYVELSESYKRPDIVPENEPCNIKANFDGQILRMDIAKGAAAVKTGDGVIKGQLLVSGVVEDSLGNSTLWHSEAKVYAQTKRSEKVEIPLVRKELLPTGESVTRKQGRLLNIKFPMNFCFVPQGYYFKQAHLDNYTVNGNGLPFDVYTENWYEYKEVRQTLTEKQAEQSAMTRLALIEAFQMLDTEIKDRQIKKTLTKNSLVLEADYTCVEDIGYQTPIGIETQ